MAQPICKQKDNVDDDEDDDDTFGAITESYFIIYVFVCVCVPFLACKMCDGHLSFARLHVCIFQQFNQTILRYGRLWIIYIFDGRYSFHLHCPMTDAFSPKIHIFFSRVSLATFASKLDIIQFRDDTTFRFLKFRLKMKLFLMQIDWRQTNFGQCNAMDSWMPNDVNCEVDSHFGIFILWTNCRSNSTAKKRNRTVD